MRVRGVSQWRGAVRVRGVSQWSCGRDGAYLWHLDEEASRARGVSLGRGSDPLLAVHVDLGDALLAGRLWGGGEGGGKSEKVSLIATYGTRAAVSQWECGRQLRGW